MIGNEIITLFFSRCVCTFDAFHVKFFFFNATFWSTILGQKIVCRIDKSRSSNVSILFRNVDVNKSRKKLKNLKWLPMMIRRGVERK